MRKLVSVKAKIYEQQDKLINIKDQPEFIDVKLLRWLLETEFKWENNGNNLLDDDGGAFGPLKSLSIATQTGETTLIDQSNQFINRRKET